MLIGLDWAEPMMHFVLHVTCSCISHAYVPSFQYIWYYWCCFGLFWLSFLFLPLFLFTLVVSMAPKHKFTLAWNPLRFGASSSSDPSPSNVRFCDDDAFKAFSKDFTVGDGSHCVTSRSHVLSCLSRSFTPTCMGLIVLHLSSSLAFEIRAFLSHRS